VGGEEQQARSQARLRYAPALVYPAKSAYTRARSLRWRLRAGLGGGAGDSPGDLRVLLYHRVSDDDDRLAVAVSRFADQMTMIAQRGIRLVDLDSAVELWTEGGQARPVYALTFDDGYRDMLTEAAPILRRHGFTATLYVAIGAIDGTDPFPWYADGSRPPMLSWDEVRSLAADGVMRVGAHTLTHPNLLTLDDETAWREISESRRVLEDRVDVPVSSFSYPAGLYGEREVGLAQRAGFASAVTCDPGVNRMSGNVLALRRTQVERTDRLSDVAARLGGGHDKPFPFQRAFRRVRYGAATHPADSTSTIRE